jgi:hypothetical protein
MGRISAVFKADGAETGQLYSISEWWLDPHTKGPGTERAGVLNVSAPGNFEQHMPGIAQWFAEHPPGDTRL